MTPTQTLQASTRTRTHRVALLATFGTLVVAGGTVLFAGYSIAAGKSIVGRGVARSGADAGAVPVDVSLTVPNDEKLNGESLEIRVGSATKVYQNIGQTPIGGALQPVKTKRIRAQNVEKDTEVTFKGTYSPGDKNSVKASEVRVADRSYAVCGKLQGITRRTAAGVNQDTLTVEVTKRTVQEKRYERFFGVKKDVVFSFGDGTQFHNAAGTWIKPRGRVGIQAADITASQQTIGLRGKVTGNATLEVTTGDLGVKCS